MQNYKSNEEDLEKMQLNNDEVPVIKRGRGRPKGAKNKPKEYSMQIEETIKKVIEEVKQEEKIHNPRNAGRKKGSLNKSTLEKIANREILDPRIYPKIKYKHPGRPKEGRKYKQDKAMREALLHPKEKVESKKKLTEKDELERCKQYALEWCYKHNAEIYKYSVQFFVFRYKNDPTRRRYQLSYEYDDYPIVWLPFTPANLSSIEM